jgi:HPt (histidine-containing phosphotransfer) domain-containing protein
LIEASLGRKQGEDAAGIPNVPLINSMIGWRKLRREIARGGRFRIIGMPLHLHGIDWMPSPPIAPDDGPIDLVHLRRMTLGDASLEREVLAMFAGQAVRLGGALATLPSDAAALAHTLKGSARAIGAFGVGDAAAYLETALRNGDDPTIALAELDEAIAQARVAIDAMLRLS